MDTLYLSHLRLAARNRDVQRDLYDCHAMHRRLMLAFPNLGGLDDARNQFAMLYRVELTSAGGDILLQSNTLPDFARLPDGYLRDPAIPSKRVDSLYAAITQGQRLVFRLRANPTKRISNRSATQSERWRGKRVELRREADQIKWLTDKAQKSGFALLAVRARPDQESIADVRAPRIGDRVTGSSGGHHLTLASVTFEGRLRVSDPQALQQTLRNGIGSGKAFGFGLLSIAAIPG